MPGAQQAPVQPQAPQGAIPNDPQQMMRDAVPLVLTLKGMDESQRQQAWPKMVEAFIQDHPQAQGMFDPNQPPDNATLNQLLPMSDDADRDPNGLTPENRKFIQSSTADASGSVEASPFDLGEEPAAEDEPPQFKVPTGYRLISAQNPGLGVEPIPGGPADKSTAEQASKIQMLRSAKDGFDQVKGLLFNPDGSINRKNITNADIPVIGGSVPWTDGRRLRTGLEYGIQAITRAETGAAMPQTEIDNTRSRFMPSSLDDDRTIRMKVEMFEKFVNGSLKLISPSGKFDQQRFSDELSENIKQSWMRDAAISNPGKTKEEIERAWNLKQQGKLNAK